MRRLWSDIDRSRDNLGIGPETLAPSVAWSVSGLLGYATARAFDGAGAIAGGAAGVARACADAMPDRFRLIGAAVPCVRRLPLVGGFFD